MTKILISVIAGIALMGCAVFQTHPDSSVLASEGKIIYDIGYTYEGFAKGAAQYIHCSHPGYLPCSIFGVSAADPATVEKIRDLDDAAYTALQEAKVHNSNGESATSVIALAGTALAAFTAYSLDHHIQAQVH